MHRPTLLLATLVSLVQARVLNVSPTGTATATGLSASEALSFSAAVGKAQAGDTLLLAGGTYSIPFKDGAINSIVFSAKGTQAKPILCMAPVGQRALIDFSFPKNSWVQDSYGFSVKGDWWDFRRISITRAGFRVPTSWVRTTGSRTAHSTKIVARVLRSTRGAPTPL